MRIDRLDLVRYGKFTDASLPFGSSGPGEADLHIVYGDNEAGKTTTLNAFLDLVFGIGASTPYKFLHQATAMRLGGVLEFAGERMGVVRLPKSGLLDSDERPVPEGMFSHELAGLDRSTYKTMFSLDEDTLEEGGESILASKGDLGQLLFSATAGLADFAQGLVQLKEEADTFYKVHGRKHELGDFKRQLAALKERRASIDVTAAPFARLIATRDAARSAYESAILERGRSEAELRAARLLLVTFPRLAEWTLLKAEVDALPEVPQVPAEWRAELADLQKASLALATRQVAASDEVDRLDADLAEMPIDEAALSVAATRTKRLADLRARDATAQKDLPDRRAALRTAEAALLRILGDLDQADCQNPRELLLRPATITRVREALEDLAGLVAAAREATAEVADARARDEEARAALAVSQALPENDQALAVLKDAIASAEADECITRLRLAERSRLERAGELADRLAVLAPWRGDADALAVLRVPERDERDLLEQNFNDAKRLRVERALEAERVQAEVYRLLRRRDALAAEHASIDDDAAAASREARNVAWDAHRSCLDLGSAKAFEAAMHADDLIVAARVVQTSALSELRSLARSLAAASADRDAAEKGLADADRELRSAEARLKARINPFVGAERDASLAALDAFLAKRDRALEARGRLRAAKADVLVAAEQTAALRDRLVVALVAVNVSTPPDSTIASLVSTGRAFVETQNAGGALRANAETASRELADRLRRLQRAEASVTHWREEWSQTLKTTWLAGAHDVGFVRNALGSLAALGSALDTRDGLADRVAKMEADRAGFAAEIRGLAESLYIPAGADIETLADRIEMRLRDASQRATSRAVKVEDRDRAATRLAKMSPEFQATQGRIAMMTSRFGATTLDDLALIFEAAQRRLDLAARIQALEIEIRGAFNVASVEEAKSALASCDREQLESRRAELEIRCEEQIALAQEAFAALREANKAVDAVDGDAESARLDEARRTILLEIEDRTMAHLALRAGIIAAENAISLYRDRHRSSMMEGASDVFASLTRGAYTGVAAQSVGDGEVLVGLKAGGGSKLSTEMSTATRSQLYLALRIAAYREFVKTRSPVPFLLDDVLETFDDDRAAASLSLLTEMAKTGQVIYLTHHKHLCTIARRVCPEAKLHDLGAIG